jgi:hypothetical protein
MLVASAAWGGPNVRTVREWNFNDNLIPEQKAEALPADKSVGVVYVGTDPSLWTQTLTSQPLFAFANEHGRWTIKLGDGAAITRPIAIAELELDKNLVASSAQGLDATTEYPMELTTVVAQLDKMFASHLRTQRSLLERLIAGEREKRKAWSESTRMTVQTALPYLDHAKHRFVLVFYADVIAILAREDTAPRKCPPCPCAGEGIHRTCAPCVRCRTAPIRVHRRAQVRARLAIRFDVDASGTVIAETRYAPKLAVIESSIDGEPSLQDAD